MSTNFRIGMYVMKGQEINRLTMEGDVDRRIVLNIYSSRELQEKEKVKALINEFI